MRSRRVVLWLVVGGALSVAAASATYMFIYPESDAARGADASQEAEGSDSVAALADESAQGTSELTALNQPGPASPETLPTEPAAKESNRISVSGGRSEHSFGNSVSFRDALERAGLSRDESTALIAGLTGVIDFRRSHPEDTFVLERNEQGNLLRFEYRASLVQRYAASCDEDGKWTARQVEVPIRVQRVSRSGVVVGSLGDTLEGLKLGRALTGVFSEVFDGLVNFSTDTRGGDEFRIIFDEEYVDDTFLRYGVVHAVEYKGSRVGRLRAFWHEFKGDGDFYDEHGRALHGGWLRTPLRYDHVSSGFGMRFHPVLKRKQLHNGIDYAAPSGTQVRAAASGTVVFAGPKGANGNLLVLSHAQGFESFYAHLLRFASGIKAGAKVTQRQVVAYVGSTGRSTGPHLHFSLKKHGKFIDPATQLNGPGLPMPASELPAFRREVRALTSALEKLTPEQPVEVPSTQPSAEPSDIGEEEDL